MRRIRSRVITLLAALAASCGDPSAPPDPEPDPDPEPAPLPAVRMALDTIPIGGRAGQSLAPAVVVALLDSTGNRVAADTHRVTVSLEGPFTELQGTRARNAVGGRVAFDDLRITHADTGYVLVFSTPDFDTVRAPPIAIGPAPAAGIRFTVQPSNHVAGTFFTPPPEAELIDAFDNPVTDTTEDRDVRLDRGLGPGDLLAIRPTTGGAVRFDDVGLPDAGIHVITVRVAGLAPDASVPFTVSPSAPARMVIEEPPPTIPPRTPFALQVDIQDAFGNFVPDADGIPVTLSLGQNPTAAVLGGVTTAPSANGIARFADLTIDRSGRDYRIAAEAPGLWALMTNAFNVVFDAQSVAGGGAHGCLLHVSGRVYCWGDNAAGQLGDGSAGGLRGIPAPVPGGYVLGTLAAGGAHACAGDSAGTAWCWGDNTYGQLGVAGGPASTPVPVQGVLSGIRQIAAGERHTCALFTTPNGLFCWGDNSAGQLGGGTTGGTSPSPVVVSGDVSFVQVTIGAAHTCGLDGQGNAYCWGDNTFGQLGDGRMGTASDRPVAVSGDLGFTKLVAGWYHTCAITESQFIACWGRNDAGQLGNFNVTTDSDVPVMAAIGSPVDDLAVGERHACFTFALTGSGMCWGDNSLGQLGTGATGGGGPIPLSNSADVDLESMSAGRNHTCAVTIFGAYCWGDNAAGQVANGTEGGVQATPTRIVDPGS